MLQEIYNKLRTSPTDACLFASFVDELRNIAGNSPFALRLLDTLRENYEQVQDNNICYIRFPNGMTEKTYGEAAVDLANILTDHESYSQTYGLLADEQSCSTMIEIMAYKILGHRHVRLSRNSPDYWQGLELARATVRRRKVIPTGFKLGGDAVWLDDCRFDFNGQPLSLYLMAETIFPTFILKQYEYHAGPVDIAAKPGDSIIDGGGCWGDSAAYFSSLTGQVGSVYTFEFLPFNLAIMQKNLALNPALAKQVQIAPFALWEQSDLALDFNDNGPGTSLVAGGPGGTVRTMSIDNFLVLNKISRIDFIKMDIEGAELNALRGAEATIRKFKPKLAICVYHKKDDLITIPQYLNSLDIGYKLYLSHCSIHSEETVLFAT